MSVLFCLNIPVMCGISGGGKINNPPAVVDLVHTTAMFIPQFALTTQPRCISKPQTKSRVIKSFILVNEDINSSSCV